MVRSSRGFLGLLIILTVGFFPASEAQAQKKVRFAYPSSADMGDIPSLLAWEQLKKQGIEVTPTFFPKPTWRFRLWLPAKPISVPRRESRS
jgi:hypothetical protein